MGNNCGSEDAGRGHRAFLRNGSSSDPKFRVYIHRRARVIHAWLVIFPDAIQLEQEKNASVNWPLQFIRRYGYTSAGIFFFESGRRCPTGEGFHCFQTQYADQVFRLVQERVHATVGSDHTDARISRRSVPPESLVGVESAKISHLQRFPSEGTSVMSDYRPPSAAGGSWSPSSASAYKMRKVVLPTAPRPRSVSDLDDRASQVLPRNGSTVGGDKLAGNIILMSHNPSASDESAISSLYGNDDIYTTRLHPKQTDPVIPSYVNISPTGASDLATKFTRNRTNSSSSLGSTLGSTPTTPVSKVFSINWDGGGGSTNVICYPMSSTSDYANCGPTVMERQNQANYVNVQMTPTRTAAPPQRETTPSRNYVDVHTDSPANTLTRSRRPEFQFPPNYTLIDPEKTKALQAESNLASQWRLKKAQDERKPLGTKVDSS